MFSMVLGWCWIRPDPENKMWGLKRKERVAGKLYFRIYDKKFMFLLGRAVWIYYECAFFTFFFLIQKNNPIIMRQIRPKAVIPFPLSKQCCGSGSGWISFIFPGISLIKNQLKIIDKISYYKTLLYFLP